MTNKVIPPESADKFLEAKRCEKIRVIFDGYDKNSLKSQTRCSRINGIAPRQYRVTYITQISSLDIREFLASTHTKTEFLSRKLSVALTHRSSKYAISYGNTTLISIPDLRKDLMTYRHEETGTGIVLHAIDISTRSLFTDLSIVCDDTDVLLILLHYFGDLSVSTNFVTQHNTMSLRLIHEVLGRDNCEALLGFHALNGYDQTGKFYGHSNLNCWHKSLSSLRDVIKAFRNLGVDLGKQEKDSPVKYVMGFYCKGKPKTISDLGELRWFLFLKHQIVSIRLPPTTKAFEQAIQRSHFTTLQWKSSHITSPILPDPCDFHWKWDDAHKVNQTLLTTNLPALESIIVLSSCKCKAGCNSCRGRCHKNSFVRSEMCLCQKCQNSLETYEMPHQNEDHKQ